MKYPYISKWNDAAPYIIYSDTLVRCLGHENHKTTKVSSDAIKEFFSKNITREYLANTKIRILSPEHSAFVQKLAFNAGYEWSPGECLESLIEMPFLYIYKDGEMGCSPEEDWFINQEHKEITIPMPPTENKEEDMKNNGDNLMFGGEDKCEGWLCALDKALCSASNQECEVVSTCGEFAWVSFEGRDAPETRHISQLSNPKTPEEEFRKWMTERIGSGIASGCDCEDIANDLINNLDTILNHLNITKKPQ